MTVDDRRELRKTILILIAFIAPFIAAGIAGVIIGEGSLIASGFMIPIPLIFALIFHLGLYFT